MQIRFPFAYEAEVRVGRNRQKSILGEWATVEIREIGAEDAPLLAEFERANIVGEVVTAGIREFDGRCYRPMRDVPHGKPYDIFAPQVGVDALGQANPIVKTFFRHGWGDVTSRGTDGIEPDDLATILAAANNGTDGFDVVGSCRDAVLRRNQNAAANLIVIEGEVWEQCLAPHLLLSLSSRPPEVRVSFEAPDFSRVLRDDLIAPISEMSSLVEAVNAFHAIDERRELTDERGRPYRERAWTPAEVVYPTVTSFGPSPLESEIPYIVGRAEHYLTAHFGHMVGDLQHRSVALVRSWADLKEAVEETKANPGSDTVDRLLAALGAYAERCKFEAPRHDKVLDKPMFGTEREKARTDLRLSCEVAAWTAFAGRVRDLDHQVTASPSAPAPR
ncbi:hypothetical protein OIU34_23655 [Pararhizobium sp. BT-229]|uniref:hypothetical protein n=1 Tax=Pararhizobium sp. BT-229 TaxID=2986923 RepID=UPI0021F6D46A|nr:hypothetical protein [Pararhizobium sp. BT-229]MCV9964893.1 hypothetical protein [Pararhizobium sp. BT-229]